MSTWTMSACPAAARTASATPDEACNTSSTAKAEHLGVRAERRPRFTSDEAELGLDEQPFSVAAAAHVRVRFSGLGSR